MQENCCRMDAPSSCGNDNTIIVPVADQPKDRMYKMSIRFVSDLVPTRLADFVRDVGFDETPVLVKALTSRIEQVYPFIPDDEVLEKYAKTIDGSRTDDFTLANTTFDGYDYIYPVTIKKEDNE